VTPAAGAPGSAASWTPVRAARPHVHPTRVVSTEVVALVTGDRVRVSTLSDGRQAATLLPGSPGYGKPVQTMATPTATFVVPKMSWDVRRHYDLSVFDVTALAAAPDETSRPELAVRFVDGATPRDLPGLAVDESAARQTKAGATVAPATYSPGSLPERGLDQTALRGVAAVTQPASETRMQAAGDYQLHTLTVEGVNRRGRSLKAADVWVQNVDDGRLFIAPVFLWNGSAKVMVPEGHYSVMTGGWSWVVVESDIAVTGDTTLMVDARDATTRPSEHVEGHRPIDTTVVLQRASERAGTFTWSFSSWRFDTRVSPQRPPAHGLLRSSVGATLMPRSGFLGADMETARLVSTRDYRAGIPADLSFTHGRRDFARVTHDYYSNGPVRYTSTFVYPFAPWDGFAFISGVPAILPSSRPVWLQGDPRLSWLQSVDGVLQFRPFRLAVMRAPFMSYGPGVVEQPLPFFRGPVGPGLERGLDAARVGPGCLLCRKGNELRGRMPLWSAAGTRLDGTQWDRSMGSWSLESGWRTLDRGHGGINVSAELPAAEKEYLLTATASPDARAWQLSTRVSDTWTFRSGTGTGVVPLLMPSYVPRASLDGYLPQGRVSMRLSFENLGPASRRVAKATVLYSADDFHSWRQATLTRLDKNTFRVTYVNPERTPQRRFVSLEVFGRDSAGNTVSERAMRVYRIGNSRLTDSHGRTSDGSGPGSPPAPDQGSGTDAKPACKRPVEGRYRCFALVDASGAEAMLRAGDPAGWGATDLRDAYGVPASTSDQTVAVVVAHHYPSAERDLNRYRRTFGLPPCTSASGCFTQINERGQPHNYPEPDQGWALEAALDLQMVSAACPSCSIILAEANSPSTGSLNHTVDAAVAAGADVTNHSYGVTEYTGIRAANPHYDVDGVTAVAATGDSGYQPASFPASSPDVVAVGGTVLHRAGNPRGFREAAWTWGGSGCSAYFAKPAYQSDSRCPNRTFADLSAVSQGVSVYSSFGFGRQRGWFVLSGTSVSSPFVAGLIAAAGGGGLKPGDLYDPPDAFRDITRGSNGWCKRSYLCTALPGYDAPTGWGTPKGLRPFQPVVR
jgi:hypothetical protein